MQKATRCALFAVLELAADPERQLSATEIAATYGLSLNHLAKVLPVLGRAGLVQAVRGAGGGYKFCGDAAGTSLLEVIRLFETMDPISQGQGQDGDGTALGRSLNRLTLQVERTAHATFGSVTIAEMLRLTARGPRI